ncbi:hypothetical protein D3C75_615060 [compost metagenome]
MKIKEIIPLHESVYTFLDQLIQFSDDGAQQETCARYVATMMVLRDMDMRYKEEDHPLKANTMIDYMYGDAETTKKALNGFKARIDANPRARILWTKYFDQYMDFSFGPKAMKFQIKHLRSFFDQRKAQRTTHHETTLVKNFAQAQQKVQDNYQELT